ncbi:MAG: hypothetical protein R2705_21235 [Ilumatobacteraceae bacterium]
MRYNADISQPGLDAMGLGHIRSSDVAKLDAVKHLDDLSEIGSHLARQVSIDHLSDFI